MKAHEFRQKLYLIDSKYKEADAITKNKLHRKAELYELLLNLFPNETESILDRYYASITRILNSWR